MPDPQDTRSSTTRSAGHRGQAPQRGVYRHWNRLTEGLALEQLWKQFAAEARESYGLYSGEVNWGALDQQKSWKRPFHGARALFRAMLMKLSPARRVLLLVAAFLLIYPLPALLVLVATRGHFEALFFALAATLFFLLLALELADRVMMKRDLEIAREIQQWLVPVRPPDVAGLDIAFSTRPANTVAGDYYDAFFRPNGAGRQRLLLVVADVAGKGVPAALLMATFQASLRALAASSTPLAELVAGLNHHACAHSLNGRRFTTAFFAEIDPDTRALTYINAGHNAPILARASGAMERLEAGGLPLGIPLDLKGTDYYVSGGTTLAAGDLLAVFTDGLIEAVSPDGEEYSEKRLLDAISAQPSGTATEAMNHVIGEVDRFVGVARQHDDVTCLFLRAAAAFE
jgi:phosphoserine phosphatase RsbU/P